MHTNADRCELRLLVAAMQPYNGCRELKAK